MNSFRASLAILSVAVVSLSVAQGPGGRPGPGGPPGGPGGGMGRRQPGERQKKMMEDLGLTATQKKKAEAIFSEFMAKNRKLMPPPPAGGKMGAGGPGGPGGGGRPQISPELRKKMTANREEFMTKLKKILTPAQTAKLEKMQAEARARFGGGGGRMGGPGGRMGGPGGAPGGAKPGK